MAEHQKHMQRCLELAEKGFGHVAPNPMVGAVVVHNGQVIGEGSHQKYGEAHAEANAINSVSNPDLLKESTLYVNLEPCSHHGKTPPCVNLIIEKKIPHVVIGSVDPNPYVSGKGIDKLKISGCTVEVGVLEEQSKALNKRFYTFHEKKRPYVILKWAQTQDGYISSKFRIQSPSSGQGALKIEEKLKSHNIEWISNETSRKLAHRWRSEEQGIMVGTNTVLLDNPRLTVRDYEGKNPIRIIIDKWLRVPKHYHIYDKAAPTIIFNESENKVEDNISLVKISFENDIVDQILQELYNRNIQSVMIEGGELLFNTFMQKNKWDEARVLIANKEFGKGVKAPDISGKNVSSQQNIAGDQLLVYENL